MRGAQGGVRSTRTGSPGVGVTSGRSAAGIQAATVAAAALPELTAAANAFTTANTTGLTDAVLNTGGAGPSRDDVINWARGIDTNDADGDGDRTEQVRRTRRLHAA